MDKRENELNLIIFIDSFPSSYIDKIEISKELPYKANFKPGFGYSINCQAEIFTGKKPDELGYFCDWSFNGSVNRYIKYKYIFGVLSIFDKIYYIDRLFHRGLEKTLFKDIGSIKNIPFKYIYYFDKNSIEVIDRKYKYSSLLNNKDVLLISVYDYPKITGRLRDLYVFKDCLSAIESGKFKNIIITLTELDSIGHWYGLNSKEYDEYVNLLDNIVTALFKKLMNKNKKAKMVILSDHGMVNVKGKLNANIEFYLPEPSMNTFLYYIDGTIIRFWIFDEQLEERIKSKLNRIEEGKILSYKERERFGLLSKMFGDIIFLANEGYMFVPSFWGGNISKAMHGYHPDLESQRGVLLSSEDDVKNDIKCSIDCYNYLKSIISQK